AVRYMQRVAGELMRAYRRGTIASFDRVLARHADVPGIAMYSLGRYQRSLPRGKRPQYYRGVRAFMARYFAEQSHKYEIVKGWIEDTPIKDGDGWLVRSRVKLASGSTYNVVWRVTRKNGDVNALVAALNR
ncbi:MAG TPA: hypothetical protein ENK13_01435, partial [Thermopetrobacter sp.]|nr:hypothetical protein [Thermopetrobacter sp.]